MVRCMVQRTCFCLRCTGGEWSVTCGCRWRLRGVSMCSASASRARDDRSRSRRQAVRVHVLCELLHLRRGIKRGCRQRVLATSRMASTDYSSCSAHRWRVVDERVGALGPCPAKRVVRAAIIHTMHSGNHELCSWPAARCNEDHAPLGGDSDEHHVRTVPFASASIFAPIALIVSVVPASTKQEKRLSKRADSANCIPSELPRGLFAQVERSVARSASRSSSPRCYQRQPTV